MLRRNLLKALMAAPLPATVAPALASHAAAVSDGARALSRVRPGDIAWPAAADWAGLSRATGGRLLPLGSAFAACSGGKEDAACEAALQQLHNPFYVGDHPALTQTSGWIDAWASRPSAYAVAAQSTADVVAAVNFARRHRLRLVVKGGGHSYQGTSNAPDSLLVWTRAMKRVTLHEAFVAQGCAARQAPQAAVSIEAGAMWADAYDAVTTRAGRYVQGGGCTSVGVAGLVQSGGFGSFSKRYGTAAAGLIEAELVTADGVARVVNACSHPELFWALKGGGGGSFGVVTRMTLRTRELPQWFGAVFGTIQAASDESYKALIARIMAFYRDHLFNPHWGEQIRLQGEKELGLSLVFEGLDPDEVRALWAPFVDWVQARRDYTVVQPIHVLGLPARHLWDLDYLQQHAPAGVMQPDNRPGAPHHHAAWGGDLGQVGWFIHGYQSAWLPASLLKPERQDDLVDALVACKRHWDVALHVNKGLAGAAADELAAVRDTATNPQVLDAFALAICAGGGGPAYPGMPGPGPDAGEARRHAETIGRGMRELLKVAPRAGAYVSESNYFQADWQDAFWGSNYERLLAVKQAWDPEGLFFVRHGVGSEAWSEDGFRRLG